MEEQSLFPEDVYTGTELLFFNLGDKESRHVLTLMHELRTAGVRCELYHEPAKFDKQFKYADKKHIPNTVVIGSKEMDDHTCVIKNLKTGMQETISTKELVERYKVGPRYTSEASQMK